MVQQICTGSSALEGLWGDRAPTPNVLVDPAAQQSLHLLYMLHEGQADQHRVKNKNHKWK